MSSFASIDSPDGKRAAAFALATALLAFMLALSGDGAMLLHPAVLLAPLVVALVQRCGGPVPALAATAGLMAALGASGAAAWPTIAALGLACCVLLAVLQWIGDATRERAARQLEQPGTGALEQALAEARAAAAANERAIRAREELLSLVSHDLRSALNAMVGWLYLARSPTIEDGPRQRALEGIASAIDTQRRLVDQLLEATRVLDGRTPPASRPVLPEVVLRQLAPRLAQRAAERSVNLCIEPTPPGLSFDADPARVEEALCAMFEHALAVTPARGVLRIRAMHAAPSVMIDVDGHAGCVVPGGAAGWPGAPAIDVPAPRLAASPTLSLAIARAVTALQGGCLEIRPAAPGAGVQLSLRFPAAPGHPGAAEPEQPGPQAMATAQAPSPAGAPGPAAGSLHGADPARDGEDPAILGGCYILLTDDREDMLEVSATVLRSHGAHVTTARSGAESIDLYPAWARAGGERVMISDLSMPEIDGLEMIGRIRRLERESGLPRLPAVAFSAQADQYPRLAVIQAGFDLFLAKPLSPARLIDAISQLIGK